MAHAGAFDYEKTQATALKLLKRFGEEYTFTRTTDGAYNPATGKTSQPSSKVDIALTNSLLSKYGPA